MPQYQHPQVNVSGYPGGCGSVTDFTFLTECTHEPGPRLRCARSSKFPSRASTKAFPRIENDPAGRRMALFQQKDLQSVDCLFFLVCVCVS